MDRAKHTALLLGAWAFAIPAAMLVTAAIVARDMTEAVRNRAQLSSVNERARSAISELFTVARAAHASDVSGANLSFLTPYQWLVHPYSGRKVAWPEALVLQPDAADVLYDQLMHVRTFGAVS